MIWLTPVGVGISVAGVIWQANGMGFFRRGTHSVRLQISAAVAIVALVASGVVWWATEAQSSPITPELVTISVPSNSQGNADVELEGALYLPAETPAPAVILGHGFGGSWRSTTADARRLTAAGFVVISYSARGFGMSTGAIHLNSLDYEIADARHVVDWLAERPEVTLDAPGDPRVGVMGSSYGGALALMLAGTDNRIDAVVAAATWNDLSQALFPSYLTDSAAHADTAATTVAAIAARGTGVYQQAWAAALLSSTLKPPGEGTNDTAAAIASGCGRLAPDLCHEYQQAARTGILTPELQTLLAASSPAAVAQNISAPTLLVQGEADTLFGLDQADANARAITAAGAPVAMSWYPGGHNGGPIDERTHTRMDGWLQHYLRGVGNVSTAFEYTVPGPTIQRGNVRTRTLSLPEYPGLGAKTAHYEQVTMDPNQHPRIVTHPPGGQPAAITSLPGVSSIAAGLAAAATLPGQSATFLSQPLDKTMVVTGTITVTLDITPIPSSSDSSPGSSPAGDPFDAVFYTSLSKVPVGTTPLTGAAQSSAPSPEISLDNADEAEDSAVAAAMSALSGGIAGGAVAPIRVEHLTTDGQATRVVAQLPATVYQIAAGERLAIRIATTDQGFMADTVARSYYISLVDTTLDIPAVGGLRAQGSDDTYPIGLGITVGLMAIMAVVGMLLVGRFRRRPTATLAQPSAAPPLEIEDLAKTYPGGVAAVSRVSLTVQPGQVLGLLGPNGAGKTTTLRMVMGLISPTAGQVRVFGHTVTPGHPVLSRIGSFVEGSGFLPHLSGLRNLELYWKATGRPAAHSALDTVLQIADLGAAIHRATKTYSQGMRQRLAIAQAMLGLPELLLLDEPTNGLDPPQIHAMREVLQRYAATGRTVLISSHLLSEVEQTCSHVVVMSQGRTIAAGTVTELVAQSGFVTIGTPQAATAHKILQQLPGIGTIEVVPDGVAIHLEQLELNDVLQVLLTADISVTFAAPRNRLEDVFLDLVGSGPAGGKSSQVSSAASQDGKQ